MIKVGDIVRTKNKEGKDVIPAVVTKIYLESGNNAKAAGVDVLFADGTHGYRTIKKLLRQDGILRYRACWIQ